MTITTIGVKLDEQVRQRIRAAAEAHGRTPHFVVKQMILQGLERLERGEPLQPAAAGDDGETPPPPPAEADAAQIVPFLDLAQEVQPQTVLRAAITAAYRRPETECVPALLSQAALPPRLAAAAQQTARSLATRLRAKRTRGIVETLLQEYALSSQEGIALMCLAEALLRIPDTPTRDALIRDKIGSGDWQSHLGTGRSLFVNAATWGLLLTGRLVATSSEASLSSVLTRLVARSGEPVVRGGVNIAMRLMGEQFVLGQTIADALANSRKWEAKGFRHSYDMLGEAALTAHDAERYLRDYEQAIHAIGKSAQRRGIYQGPGISIKLSALHPRYGRAQRRRVMDELLPRLTHLARLARQYDIGLNIDAEEADRLEISLDLLESLCFDPALQGWNGIGFVVQSYQKRAPFVLDFLIDLAQRSRRRLMVRLVKGAYWDTEIKRAQVDGLEGFPVFTRKVHTDLSYLACARKLLAAPQAVFPQFATHNAHTVAAIHAMAGENFYLGQYEFQCLHGMGEPLYEEVVSAAGMNRPCRIYAPVGTHETLLAYLVRRLLENGANTSFVHRINDPSLSLDEIIADPAEVAARITPLGAPHDKIVLPRALYGSERANSAGFDLSNEQRLGSLTAAGLAGVDTAWIARPILASGEVDGPSRPVRNPADLRDQVGSVTEATPELIDTAVALALQAAPVWQSTPAADRAAILSRAADLIEERLPRLVGLIVREAGRTLPAAIGEVREAVDFLRYYAAQVAARFHNAEHRPLGPVVAISPWNFPLSIFTGQIAAALAAGNVVLAKPAEQTPLVAYTAVHLLLEAGVPPGALQLLPGDGRVGAALVADSRVRAVLFTGSTEVARLIQAQLAQRLDAGGLPIPLIAETGGQNAMVVDSSALPEQAVADIIASAFDSAGQRCSALRILLVQEDVAPRLLDMLRGAMAELTIGRPDRLDTDVGPVISAEARDTIDAHIDAMRGRGLRVDAPALAPDTRHGWFVAPTLIEIESIDVLGREVFGPVLHVLRYRSGELDAAIDAVNALGYALTFGIHSRIDETIAHVISRIEAGNIYVNRNIIGAVVGVQPFGGHARSGTGPKAGGPLYLRRLIAPACAPFLRCADPPDALRQLIAALHGHGIDIEALRTYARQAPALEPAVLPGPVGEQNQYLVKPRGALLCRADSRDDLLRQVGAALASGNRALLSGPHADAVAALIPEALRGRVRQVAADDAPDAALYCGDPAGLLALQAEVARYEHAVVPVHALPRDSLVDADYPLELLLHEQSISVNTAAAGGNASLMTIG
ncbi:MAG: trifunctional transcriptional regulator/proline dehydrogenase/L-glutamate gamma-semialdehyde dehydrogenase [Thiomonas sp.]|uniref:trifunctional transcriptional regulator/proline dehydrogenase/L-glutamate gamma-semialdehyde dehydrogenase n=1 Tax=Thiomonas sp. TaxID=2047785 RepID=UPI002A35C5D9|nr:trifunctional transcriptional regulator/proline dehydrogenase/L-glutamate gamma-semialdehyde dehydrogenase [Thiomonas sp.]MDY0330254.1 trifunctional transcriptional regulator/proline dehydrogenase/L-glutamate gamma-semialdehyde dehydrogenase [Thiomonas sp.]